MVDNSAVFLDVEAFLTLRVGMPSRSATSLRGVGFDTSAYSVGYIAGWSDEDTDLTKSTPARVLRTAHQIAGILTPENEETSDAEDAA
ncbi:hypothetical protein [Frondihabitans sp. PhB188]|uniref:hypothetical protein n=1 Tax=Frondihabitans sp. PhB188 TaxID=2485200 RepID=UPI000F490C58|nr:hypothetical protein [Frondihabitans sp. PhB188]